MWSRRIDPDLRGLDARQTRISGNHGDDGVLKPLVVPVRLDDERGSVLAAASRRERKGHEHDVAAPRHDGRCGMAW